MSKEFYIQEVSKYLADLQTRIDDSDKRQVAELLNAIPLYGEEMFNRGRQEIKKELEARIKELRKNYDNHSMHASWSLTKENKPHNKDTYEQALYDILYAVSKL